MEPEGSLSHSQQPATCPCPEPDRSCPPFNFSKINFNIIPPSMPGSPKWSPTLRFSYQNPVCTSFTFHVPNLISIFLCLSCTEWPVWFRRFLEYFVKWVISYGEELLPPRPTPKLEDHPLSAVRDCLLNIFAAAVQICRPFLHPQLEDAPWSCDRDPLITQTGTHLSLWQGPTYHWDRDPLITETGTHLSLWQGPTYHWDRDPLITETGTHLSLWQGPTYRWRIAFSAFNPTNIKMHSQFSRNLIHSLWIISRYSKYLTKSSARGVKSVGAEK